ncbi:glycine/D-amino acid oxidase-like deaminating enzyme [Rhodovulum bhavnagarense]|uniref:Glycine/D-amino acid oxidase-like deaminating enzyme n=1 Tax=Rhodovulum bhavnagarense TaxID=992286 RepID=A0A4R2RFC1_9RHOB|nr:FAD-binding oxidoreductase [Rhodovulum bhavnagarense]TCP61334.1 glycine/D-amino acid oxidase-like deaminating enzyme [Rhodovulum bhavnagarense]
MLRRIYEDAAYAAGALDGCYWTQTAPAPACPSLHGTASTEFAVIGAGDTGLSAALALAEAGADVALLDLHAPGWGASGRNGGFVCLGGAWLGRSGLVRRYGEAGLAAYRMAERRAIEAVAALIENHGMAVDRHSDGEVVLLHKKGAIKVLEKAAREIRHDHGIAARVLAPEELVVEGLSGPRFHGGLHVELGFAVNPRKLVLGLAEAAGRAGARLYANSPVQRITHENGRHVLETPGGRLSARNVILATNGYSAENLPGWMRARYLPVQSSVLVTRPLGADEIAEQGWFSELMAYDTRSLLHYFRLLPERRFLFGMRGGIGWTPATHARIRRQMRADFEAMFPAWKSIETPFFWSGLVNLNRSLIPFAGPIAGDNTFFAAFGYHGNGIAHGIWAGAQVARLAMGQPAPDLPDFYRQPPPRFELGAYRRAALRGAYPLLTVLDRL